MTEINETKAAHHWSLIGEKNHHGIALPLFSLHSKESCGIGEYPDLLPLIDWCKECGFNIIQLLPLNDTGMDVSPYNSLSANALNPLHISIKKLPGIENVAGYAEKLASLQKLNDDFRVSYDQVRSKKYALFKEYFPLAYPTLSKSLEYLQFVQNHPWLHHYALFKTLKEEQGWKSWEEWPLKYRSPSENILEEHFKNYQDHIAFHVFLQFFCFKQLEEVKTKANQLGIRLKGDIPILISRDSADVWAERRLFLLKLAAGSPPDMYCKDGQYWGFPVYDWEAIEKENHRWWEERLKTASYLYDLYRLDHVVGFYRLWTIKLGKKATEGVFLPSERQKWIVHGQKIMEMMLASSLMLPIGEDLGSVPPDVKQNLIDLGIPGTKMMRWERRWEEDGSFIPIDEYPPISMTTVSTHDSDTVKLWWRHFPKEAKLFCEFKGWDYRPFITHDQQVAILKESHHSASLFHINQLMEYLALFPELISADPNAERINIPGKILPSNWTYRFRPSVEDLLAHEQLKKIIREIL